MYNYNKQLISRKMLNKPYVRDEHDETSLECIDTNYGELPQEKFVILKLKESEKMMEWRVTQGYIPVN